MHRRTVSFNKKIYASNALREAIRYFSEFAKITSRNKKDYLEVVICSSKIKEAHDITDEFMNYALILTKKCH